MTAIHIAAHELQRLLRSPLAWILFATGQLLLAIFYFVLLSHYLKAADLLAARGLTQIVGVGILQLAGLLVILLVPFLTMRLFSDERRNGTIRLLFSSPVTLTEMVIGKYLGTLLYLYGMVLLFALLPLSLAFGSSPDLGQLAAGLLGLLLLVSSCTAIGLFISTLSAQPVSAAVMSFGILFLLWILEIAGLEGGELLTSLFAYLSLSHHYEVMLSGICSSVDVTYYLLLTLLSLILAVWRLDLLRS